MSRTTLPRSQYMPMLHSTRAPTCLGLSGQVRVSVRVRVRVRVLGLGLGLGFGLGLEARSDRESAAAPS